MGVTFTVTASMQVGLIGYPVAHSRSPAMHRAAFAACGLAWTYELLPVPPDALAETLDKVRGATWRGVNVTVPHKQAVMPLLDAITPNAHLIGAVNTIVNEGGRLIGHNTDWRGFLAALREGGFEPQGCRVVLLGAGGAARAVLYALLESNATVTIANRNRDKAQQLAAEFGARFQRDIPVLSMGEEDALQNALAEATLLVNSTSVGMSPDIHATPLPPSVILPSHLTVYDLVYAPRETLLLKEAQEAGATAIDGLGMLVHQGAEAFRLWTGLEPPVGVMRAAVE